MESEKFICVRETGVSNSVVIVDMANPMQPMKRCAPASIEATAPSRARAIFPTPRGARSAAPSRRSRSRPRADAIGDERARSEGERPRSSRAAPRGSPRRALGHRPEPPRISLAFVCLVAFVLLDRRDDTFRAVSFGR